MADPDHTLELLRAMRSENGEIRTFVAAILERVGALQAESTLRFERLETDIREMRTAVNRHTLVLDTFADNLSKVRGGSFTTDIAIRAHENELFVLRARIERLEEK